MYLQFTLYTIKKINAKIYFERFKTGYDIRPFFPRCRNDLAISVEKVDVRLSDVLLGIY